VTEVSDFMPTRVEELLDVLGVRPDPNVTTAVDAGEPKVERDFTFKQVQLDENGEPPW